MPTRAQLAAAGTRRTAIRGLTFASRFRVVGPAADACMRVLFDSLAPRWDRIRADAIYAETMDRGLDGLRGAATKPTAALDIACGTGMAASRVMARHPDVRIACADVSPRMIELVQERFPDADARVARSHELPWDDASFDLCTSLDGIVSAPELVRVTKPGGTCLIIYSRGGAIPVARPLDGLRREFEDAGCTVRTADDGPWILWAQRT